MILPRHPHDPDWLSVRQVATWLGVSEWQVQVWVRAGRFAEIVVFGPGLIWIARTSYERFVQRRAA